MSLKCVLSVAIKVKVVNGKYGHFNVIHKEKNEFLMEKFVIGKNTYVYVEMCEVKTVKCGDK